MPLGPGFHYQPIRWELLGETPDDWRAYIPVAAPHLCDSGDVISIGDRYFLSMGAHATHEHLLMDKTAMEPLTIAKSFAATALVAFAIDSPVVPQHREDQAEYAAADLDKSPASLSRLASASHRCISTPYSQVLRLLPD